MVFHQVRLFRAPIWRPSGGINGGTREAGGTAAESLVGSSSTRKGTMARATGRVSTRFSESGGQLDRPRTRGVLNPCARESKARTGGFPRGKLISDHGLFSSYEGQQGSANGQDSCGIFSEMHKALDGWMLVRAPASPVQGLHRQGPRYFNFPYFCTPCGLEKLRLVDQNRLERDLSSL